MTSYDNFQVRKAGSWKGDRKYFGSEIRRDMD